VINTDEILTKILIADSEIKKISNQVFPVDEDYPFKSNTLRFSEVSLQKIHNARLVSAGRGICVFDELGQPVAETVIGDLSSLTQVNRNTPSIEIAGTALVMTSLSPHCYYHWLVDTLPAFEILKYLGIEHDDIDMVFLKKCNKKFQLKALETSGFSGDKVFSSNFDVIGSGDQHFLNARIDRILIPRFRDLNGGWPNKWVVQPMHRKYGQESAPKKFDSVSDTKSRIYIKRGKGSREIVNEINLIYFLEKRGFQIVEMSDRSIEDQCAIIQSADLILGAHGSGLANAIFATAGTYLIEFYGEYIASHFRVISEIANLKYGVFKAGVVSGNSMQSLTKSELRAMPFSVDIRKVDSFLSGNGI